MRAIYLLVALVISAQAHADNMAKVPQLTGDIFCHNCGGSGINTTQQVLDAKLLIDDIGEKQKAKDELAKSSADTVTVVLGKLLPIQTCAVTPEGYNNGILNYCGPPTVKVPRQLIVDALQSQIDDDKAKLSAMGIKQ